MDNCSCIYVNDCESFPDFFTKAIRKARKVHKCGECSREIQPGEKYEYYSGRYEDKFSVYKTCLDCVSIRKAFFCEGYFFEMIHDDLQNHIEYLNGEISEDCIKDLTPGARAIVCELIEKEWKIWDEDDE